MLFRKNEDKIVQIMHYYHPQAYIKDVFIYIV